MRDEQLQTIEQVNQFLEWSEALEFRGITTEEKYRWMEEALSSGTFPEYLWLNYTIYGEVTATGI